MIEREIKFLLVKPVPIDTYSYLQTMYYLVPGYAKRILKQEFNINVNFSIKEMRIRRKYAPGHRARIKNTLTLKSKLNADQSRREFEMILTEKQIALFNVFFYELHDYPIRKRRYEKMFEWKGHSFKLEHDVYENVVIKNVDVYEVEYGKGQQQLIRKAIFDTFGAFVDVTTCSLFSNETISKLLH